MELKDEVSWKKCVESNQDPYGRAVIEYAERWANLMEEHALSGEAIEQCAESTSHEADTDGITGFMYGCAVHTLSSCWARGEELRRWHNLKTQLGREGERANELGGVLNPALLNVGSSDS